MTRKNIKIPEPLFDRLDDQKEDGETWPEVLDRAATLLEEGESEDTTQSFEALEQMSDQIEALEPALPGDLESEISKLQEQIEQMPERTADILESRFR